MEKRGFAYENIKIDAVLNSIIGGVAAVDKSFSLILLNDAARKMFDVPGDMDILGTSFTEVIKNPQINALLKETIEKTISLSTEVSLGDPEDRVLKVHTNPVASRNGEGKNSGGIVFIQDITNIKKLEQIRTEFVSNVTHELKTPLTSIRGFVETLRNGAIEDMKVADKFLEIIDIEAERLYMLINDILQLSEIESRQKDSNIGVYNLKEILDETISILQGVAEKKEVTLTGETDDNIFITANRDRIKQMLINLIDNGIKYNKENGSVHVHAERSDGKIVISVKDTGIGIQAEHISRIFERFYRVDKGRSRSMGGTGLGLSIVKHIVNLYNGDIKVNSEPGKGTEFVVRFPI